MTNAEIVHLIPGRVRLLIREKRGDSAYFSGLAEKFTHFPNVQRVKTNLTIGSIVLEFIGSLDEVVRKAREEDLLAIIEGGKKDGGHPMPDRAVALPINLVSGRNINRMFMVGSALVLVGIYQTLRGEIFPAAVTVFWYAMEAFRRAG